MTARRYVLLTLLIVIVGVAAIGIGVFVVDPYAVLRGSDGSGWIADKTEIDRHADLWKSHLLASERPEVVILGNSRSEVGFDARHPAFAGKRVVNASLTRASFAEIERLYRHAVRVGRPEHLVVSIDPKSMSDTDIRPSMAQLGVGGEESRWHRRWEILKIHLSYDTLVDTVRTVRRQGQPANASLPADQHGNRSERYMAQLLAAGGGSRPVSLSYLRDDEPWKSAGMANNLVTRNLQTLSAMASDACSRGLRLTFIVPPIHAEVLEFWNLKYGPEFLFDLMHRLSETVGAAQANCSPGSVSLWTALHYTPITTERLPRLDAGNAMMMNFWEVIHFRREVGRAVLDRVLLGMSDLAVPVFELTPDVADAYLAGLAAGRADYLAQR